MRNWTPSQLEMIQNPADVELDVGVGARDLGAALPGAEGHDALQEHRTRHLLHKMLTLH